MATSTSSSNGFTETPGNIPAAGSAQTSKVQPNDVGWQFVPQYYNFVNKQPHRLHCFYNKRSTFIHGEEGDDTQPALGQQEIHDRIVAIGYDQCKVFIHSIDAQSSANGGIIILVIGEMSNKNQSWRKFTQTFFLAEQPNGYFVLNDIFRYLKEDVEEDEEEREQPAPVAEQQAPPSPAPSVPEPEPVAIDTKPAEQVTQEPAKAPEPEPEPVSAPAQVVADTVPEEAQVASIPDKDVSPSESAPAAEKPTTATPPAVEETPAPAAAPAAAKPAASPSPAPAAAAPAPNGNAPAAAAAPTPAPAPAQPAAPPKPKTWASLAASGKPWSQVATSSQAAPAPIPAPAPKKEEAPAAPAAPSPAASTDGKHPFFVNASRVNTPHCFVKLPNWSAETQGGGESMSENDVRNVAARFGEVKKVEIVRAKACAFVEFARTEFARKAIIASLPVAQGGEDGVKFDGGKLNFETRKEKDERRPKGNASGGQRAGGQGSEGGRPRPSGQNQGGQPNGERGGQGSRGGRGPRGRGGQGNQGDRSASGAPASKQ